MSKKIESFDPNAAATGESGIFGLPYSIEQSRLVYLPIPWEATTSYGGGTSLAPQALLEASKQVDLFDLEYGKFYESGLAMLPISKKVLGWNKEAKREAKKIISCGGVFSKKSPLNKSLKKVNSLSEQLNQWVQIESEKILNQNKIIALIGGDHSTPLGAFRALGKKYDSFGILHFDAHSDTRIAYEGFTYSHASIMYNAIQEVPQISHLTQVGIRDFCEQEYEFCENSEKINVFYDAHLAARKLSGETWCSISKEIIDHLPQNVWISFDIDGLDPALCPNTGTPVPGGLSFAEANFLIHLLSQSGKRIIGFDLNEVSPSPELENEWDANVGARLLYKMTGACLASQMIIL